VERQENGSVTKTQGHRIKTENQNRAEIKIRKTGRQEWAKTSKYRLEAPGKPPASNVQTSMVQ
jgi:hypothetical protein